MVIYENKNYKVTNENGYVKILKKYSGNENICSSYISWEKTSKKFNEYYNDYPENITTVQTILTDTGFSIKEVPDNGIEMRLLSSESAPIETNFRFDKTGFKNIVDVVDRYIAKVKRRGRKNNLK